MAFIGRMVTLIIVGLSLTMFRGLVLSDLWAWFMAPLGVGAVSIWHAIGLSGLIQAMTIRTDLKVETLTPGQTLFVGGVYILFVWGVSALVHMAMVNNFLGG